MTEQSSPSSIPFSYKAYTTFVTIACAVLCALLLRAHSANQSLQRTFSEAIEKVGSAGLAVGEHIESLTVAGLRSDEPIVEPSDLLEFGDGRSGTLLFLMSGGCDTCTFSIPYFARLASLAEPHGLVSVGVQLDATGEVGLKYDGLSGFPVVAALDSSRTWLRRVPIVPAIVVVDSRGVVTRTYFGELSPTQQDSVESFIAGWTPAPEDPIKKKAPLPGP